MFAVLRLLSPKEGLLAASRWVVRENSRHVFGLSRQWIRLNLERRALAPSCQHAAASARSSSPASHSGLLELGIDFVIDAFECRAPCLSLVLLPYLSRRTELCFAERQRIPSEVV